MATLTINGLQFSGDVGSSNGFYFNGLEDWFSLTDSKSELTERPQADGAFGIGHDYRQSAVLSFTGFYRGADRASTIAAKHVLTGTLGGGQPKLAVLTDVDGSTHRIVSIRSAPITDNRDSLVFTFSVVMTATDPLCYGDSISVSTGIPMSGGGLIFPLGSTDAYWDFGEDGASGRVLVSNPGTAATFPSLSVSGGLGSGFVVTDVATGESVPFYRPIPEGSTVTVNQRTGRASIDGQSDVSGFLVRAEFFSIPAGESHQIQFAPLGVVSGSPQLTVSTAPAYW